MSRGAAEVGDDAGVVVWGCVVVDVDVGGLPGGLAAAESFSLPSFSFSLSLSLSFSLSLNLSFSLPRDLRTGVSLSAALSVSFSFTSLSIFACLPLCVCACVCVCVCGCPKAAAVYIDAGSAGESSESYSVVSSYIRKQNTYTN